MNTKEDEMFKKILLTFTKLLGKIILLMENIQEVEIKKKI
jgi:hypothetical protein